MRRIFVVVVLLSALPAAAQIQSRPTDPPLVTAVNESWYVNGEPIQFAGELYYRAGATVFFNGNSMVRSGHYNGVPLYTDTTVEPFSIVLVPISRGMMQPYEKRRQGDLAGTTGSRPPSFPVRTTPGQTAVRSAAVAPTAPPQPTGAISVYTPEPAVIGTTGQSLAAVAAQTQQAARIPGAVGTAGYLPPSQPATPIVSLRRPESNDGIWVRFGGEKWVSGGVAVPFVAADFVRVGDYAGFPVYARRGLQEETIYLPTRTGLVAPYRLKE
jgi:hypothetical protein